MNSPAVVRRVAADHVLGLTPAIAPQIRKRRGLPGSVGKGAPVAEVAQSLPAGARPQLRGHDVPPWKLRLHLWVYGITMRLGSQAGSRLPRLLQRSPYRGQPQEVPTRTGVAASGQFPVGHKQKFVLNNGERMSVLTDGSGQRYVVSQGQGRGGFGKLRVAMDLSGNLFAVKEMRLVSRAKPVEMPPPGMVARRHTKVSSPVMVLEEMAIMAAASRSMVVHTHFEVQGKVYLFLPLMADDATILATGTPGFSRVVVGREILLRTCEDLAAIHQRGFIHHDVKLHNILWNEAGAASLADFGLSCKVDVKTGTARALGRTAGNMPLEYELGDAFSWSLDTFMLGLAMADYYAGCGRDHPATGQAVERLMALESWRNKVLDDTGRLDCGRLGNLCDLTEAERLWDSHFARVCAVDPTLGAFIVERMLSKHPASRASLTELTTFVEGLQPRGGTASEAAVGVMRTIARNDWDRQRLLRHMRYFKGHISAGPTPACAGHAPACAVVPQAPSTRRQASAMNLQVSGSGTRASAYNNKLSASVAFWHRLRARVPGRRRASAGCG